jgi:hypothetical protein
MIKKTITAAAVALTLAGTGFALAQNASTPNTQGPRFSAEDVTAFTDARIAGLKAGLKLTPDQEKSWPAVETAIRDLAKQRADRIKQRIDRRTERDAIARLRNGATAMTARADGLKKLADAAEPLYKSLDDGQKRRFAVLLHMGGRSGHHQWMRRADNAR